jgi:hypothetical protein
MLRCSIFEHRQGKCKEVAYFQGREGFWSPKFGDLANDQPTVAQTSANWHKSD